MTDTLFVTSWSLADRVFGDRSFVCSAWPMLDNRTDERDIEWCWKELAGFAVSGPALLYCLVLHRVMGFKSYESLKTSLKR